MDVTVTVRLLAILGSLLMVTGCMVKPYVLTMQDIRTRATKDFQAVAAIQEPVAGPIDLYDAIARALKYNLDARVKAMQAQLAHWMWPITP